ncbi:GNAT family N-acetyltransferase [Falsirhodobacter algicola]|uniref:L-ornithine N(alpha)-acyltransferase n=1 Tax=Falsirhodobacter algicola TaxID=2692330 RepID=A0A8J8SKE7_9RHOB|nr:GNAT family N-acyltransferase [Falsirhodobacter algicola]QUS35307.1 GNAT family N-acetyltransferase [Falsirhodobacter algicola]
MMADEAYLTLRLARDDRDLMAAQRLRYRVFVEELGADGPMVDHDRRLECDRFDPYFEHLLLIDKRRDAAALDDVVGAYRLLSSARADQAGGFYSATEYDLSPLLATGRNLLELGRSCVHRDFRGGMAMMLLWNGLAAYVLERGIEILFGPASFHGTDAGRLALPLAWLHHHHLAPEELRVTARPAQRQPMDLIAADALDRKAAMLAIPSLIKAYLRFGGFVGEGAWIDREFNTTDVCLVMDTGRMSERHREFYARKGHDG